MLNETHRLLLDIIGYRLFGGEKPQLNNANLLRLLKEANAQTVYTMVFPVVKDLLREREPERFLKLEEKYLAALIMNTGNLHDHGELHELMSGKKIPYVVLKGFASAYHYPDIQLRNMGDIDFLVDEKDVSDAGKALESIGFTKDHGDEDDIHIAYRRPLLSIWELHRSLNGIPEGEKGLKIRQEAQKIISSSRLVEAENIRCRIPDDFHHGLIMLLHTASHLTSEGIGLRHLCDWAVFAAEFDDVRFREMFEDKLKAFGLWRFAQILNATCETFLRAPRKKWSRDGMELTDERLGDVLSDIISGGNFGTKDMNRYREIKYISNRDERTVNDRGIVSQLFRTLNDKVRKDYSFIGKHKILYPIGWVRESGKYLGLLLSGKRKSASTSEMLKEASFRKSLYSEMRLFETE